MNKRTTEIRQAFLDFFQSKGHQVVASSSLIPQNDPTLLFTNAGMNQFKDVFLGLDKRGYSRATSAQRCVRAGGKHNDLENVGYTARHHTFFEMLGNFSFGDYFKKDAIAYAWELLTSKDWFNLPEERLWVTVYAQDNEAFDIWANDIGVPHERIIKIGDNKGAPFASDNFWQMGDTGPCGPCTEIFYDHGEHVWGGPPGSPDESGDRYIEIWNIVFMQFNRKSDGTFLPLPHPSVDTGMGLERMAAVLQHVNSNYDIDLFQQLLRAVADVVHCDDLKHKSLRVIADHIRASAFLVSDGVRPSNEHRGYVLRRIIRRAIRHGNMLGVKTSFFYKLVAPLIQVMGATAENLIIHQKEVEQVLKMEEEQFAKTLERGLFLLDNALANLKGDTLDGETVFRLYDTFGFPLDLTADVCREHNIKIDEKGFEEAMTHQRRRARKASNFGVDPNDFLQIDAVSVFSGYHQCESRSKIVAIYINGQPVDTLSEGEEAIIVLAETPFYAESGGQVGDTGTLKGKDSVYDVTDTKKYGQAIGHKGKVLHGSLSLGDSVQADVDALRRARIALNHSATHLLHAALRQILGAQVAQKGSLVNNAYLRFDFSHADAMTPQEIRAVENLVNEKIRCNLPISTEEMSLDEAKSTGATALFGEKYSDVVRVLRMGDFSIELCGGTHTTRTGNIGLFRILSEAGVAAGVRRIEAVTGEGALEQLYKQSDQLSEIARLLKTNNEHIKDKVRALVEHVDVLGKDLQLFKAQQAVQKSATLSEKAVDIAGIKLIVCELEHVEPSQLRVMVDNLKQQLGTAVVVLSTVTSDKVSLIAGVTKNLTDRVKANELISVLAQSVGGKGGGHPDMAQAGGVDKEALPAAMKSVEGWVLSQLTDRH